MSRTYSIDTIQAGYHPEGYAIDRTAAAMQMYVKYDVASTGEWTSPEPVRFGALPRDGWRKQRTASRRDDTPTGRTVLAIASGKGGTGKTTVATNLALAAAETGHDVRVLDCDVEAPNVHLFLKPTIERKVDVSVPVPQVNEKLCTACGECGRFCQYSAIVSLNTTPLLFPELCHGCGGCTLVCPTGAITEGRHPVGTLEEGIARDVEFIGGRLKIGEPMAPPLIRAVKKDAGADGLVIIDAPPGASCPAVEAVRDADFVLLVAEPTPFGLNDLRIAVETVGKLGLPLAVVVNRAAPGRNEVRQYCDGQRIPILAELPNDRRVAEAYSCGKTVMDSVPELRELFTALLTDVLECASEIETGARD